MKFIAFYTWIILQTGDSILLDSNGNERFCFDESERVNLMYQDFPNKELEDIPSYSLLTGGWDSQHVSSMIGYILFREKLGVNATFYPTDDYLSYWNYVANYPHNHDEWISSLDLDIIFEYSKTYSTEGMKKLVLNNTVAMASSGVILTHGFYIPDYLFDEYPAAAIYAKWREPEWRQYIVNATKSQQVLEVNRSTNKPVIWHSLPTYMDAKQMEKLNVYHNLDLFFNYSGSESLNTERLLDLYHASVPFLCYSYSPMLLPALISLQRMHFPDNPTGTTQDECMGEGWCDMPDDPQQVLWRQAAIDEEWTEIQIFMMRYALDRSQIETVMLIAYENSVNHTNDFFNATCSWLKNNTAVWNDWIVPIKRWKCGERGELCSTHSVSSLEVTIYGLSGMLTILLLIWVSYKLVGFCKEFQAMFEDTDRDEASDMIEKEKRRILIAIITDIVSLSVSVLDFVTDAGSLLAVLLNKDKYSNSFLILYFMLTVFAAFACTAHLVVTMNNIMKDVFQLRTGRLTFFEQHDIDQSMRKSVVRTNKIIPNSVDDAASDEIEQIMQETEIKKLRFKLQLLTNNLKLQTVTIFVAIIEDLPFYVLNMIALSASTSSSTILLISLSINAASIGFKLCVTREFFVNLNQKAEIKESILNLHQINEKRIVRSKSQFLADSDDSSGR